MASTDLPQPDFGKMTLPDRITNVIRSASEHLPADVGRQLLGLLSPESLAIVTGVVTVWTGAQFFGVGEIADLILLIGGFGMMGFTVFEAARLLLECVKLIVKPKNKSDLDKGCGDSGSSGCLNRRSSHSVSVAATARQCV